MEELRAAGCAAGLDVVEVASAEPFVDVRRDLEQRKAEGLHGGMSFTYRQPARSTDPGAALPDAAALVVGARSYLMDDAVEPPRPPLAGRIARYAWDDHYAHLKTGLKAVAAVLKAHGWRARVLADDNAMVDRAAAHRAGIGWWGKNANLLVPGLGSWYVLGCVVTDAPVPPTSAAVEDHCGAVPTVPGRLSDRRDHRAGGGGRPALPLVVAPGGGLVPTGAPRRPRRPHLRLRRVPGGVPAEPAVARAGADGGRGAVGRPRRPAGSRRRGGARPSGALVHPQARGPVRAAQRARRARERR